MDKFEKRLEELRKKFFNQARREVGGDPNDAEDLLQDVTLALWQQRKSIDETKSFEGLFRVVLKRRGSNWRRSSGGKDVVFRQAISLDHPAGQDIPDALEPMDNQGHAERFSDRVRNTWQTSAEKQALDNWESENLSQLFQSLPKATSEALEAFYGTGLSYQQIADQAGVPIGTIKARISRGRDRLVAEATEADLV